MKSIVAILVLVLLFSACTKKEVEKQNTKNSQSKFKKPVNQPAPEREVIDLKDDPQTFDAINKINKEIPVLEIIAGTEWKQKDYESLSGFEMLDTLRLEDIKVDQLNLEFIKNIKSLKALSLSASKINNGHIEQLEESTINTLNLSNTDITEAALKSLKKMTNLTKLIVKDSFKVSFKVALPKVKIQSSP
jgi:PBP1b-binding outer membrane lipoprotein LpoB